MSHISCILKKIWVMKLYRNFHQGSWRLGKVIPQLHEGYSLFFKSYTIFGDYKTLASMWHMYACILASPYSKYTWWKTYNILAMRIQKIVYISNFLYHWNYIFMYNFPAIEREWPTHQTMNCLGVVTHDSWFLLIAQFHFITWK